MVDNKKVAAGVAVLAAVGVGAAYALTREGEPVEEGAPEGEVSLEITDIQGYSLDDVQGAWGVEATVNVNGVCNAGFPLPSMLIELYDSHDGGPDVLSTSTTIPTVVLNTVYTLPQTIGLVGNHVVYGRMVLTNALGSYEFTSDPYTFDIGAVPPGDVDIDVTLTPG